MKPEQNDFVALMDREGGKGLARKDTKVVIFEKEGDAICSGSPQNRRGLGDLQAMSLELKPGSSDMKPDAARRRAPLS